MRRAAVYVTLILGCLITWALFKFAVSVLFSTPANAACDPDAYVPCTTYPPVTPVTYPDVLASSGGDLSILLVVTAGLAVLGGAGLVLHRALNGRWLP